MREGFWKQNNDESLLPWPCPAETPWKGKARFLTALDMKEAQAEQLQTKGWSTCRICKCTNGSITFALGEWLWPIGFRHYVKSHNVRPSLAFQEFILGETLI